jgi:hypothetical protein
MNNALTVEDLTVAHNLIGEINQVLRANNGIYTRPKATLAHPDQVWGPVLAFYRNVGWKVGEQTDANGVVFAYIVDPAKEPPAV